MLEHLATATRRTMLHWVLAYFGALIALLVALLVTFNSNTLPPVEVFYEANDIGWLGYARVASGFILSGALLSTAFFLVRDIALWKSAVLRARGLAYAMLFVSASVLTVVTPGHILFGGAWHMATMVFGVVTTLVSLFTAYVSVSTNKHLVGLEHPDEQ